MTLSTYGGVVSPFMVDAIRSHLDFTNGYRKTLGLPELTPDTATAVLDDLARVLAVSDQFNPRQIETLRVRSRAAYLVRVRDLEVNDGASLGDEVGSLILPVGGREHTEMFFPMPDPGERTGQHAAAGRRAS